MANKKRDAVLKHITFALLLCMATFGFSFAPNKLDSFATASVFIYGQLIIISELTIIGYKACISVSLPTSLSLRVITSNLTYLMLSSLLKIFSMHIMCIPILQCCVAYGARFLLDHVKHKILALVILYVLSCVILAGSNYYVFG